MSPNQNASTVFPSPVEHELTKRAVEKSRSDTGPEWVAAPNDEGEVPKKARVSPHSIDFLQFSQTRRLARPADVTLFRPADDRPGSWVCEEHYVAGSYGSSCENVRTQLSTPDKDWSRRLPLRPYCSAASLHVKPDPSCYAHPATGHARKQPVWGIWVKTRSHGRLNQLPYHSIAHKETPADRAFSAPLQHSYRNLSRCMDFDKTPQLPVSSSPPTLTQWDYAGGRGGENKLQASTQLRFVPWDDRKFMLTGNSQKNWAFHGISSKAPLGLAQKLR